MWWSLPEQLLAEARLADHSVESARWNVIPYGMISNIDVPYRSAYHTPISAMTCAIVAVEDEPVGFNDREERSIGAIQAWHGTLKPT